MIRWLSNIFPCHLYNDLLIVLSNRIKVKWNTSKIVVLTGCNILNIICTVFIIKKARPISLNSYNWILQEKRKILLYSRILHHSSQKVFPEKNSINDNGIDIFELSSCQLCYKRWFHVFRHDYFMYLAIA